MGLLFAYAVLLTIIAMGCATVFFVQEYKKYSSLSKNEEIHSNKELVSAAINVRQTTLMLALSPFVSVLLPLAIVGGLGYVVWKTCVRFVPFVQTVISAFKFREEVDS